MAKDKFGPGFDREEFASPVYIGPSKGQEGYSPSNPEIGQPRDPLGYLDNSDVDVRPGRGER